MRTLSFLIWSGIFVSFCGSIFVGFFLLLNYIKFNEFDYILLFKVAFVFFIAGFIAVQTNSLIKRKKHGVRQAGVGQAPFQRRIEPAICNGY